MATAITENNLMVEDSNELWNIYRIPKFSDSHALLTPSQWEEDLRRVEKQYCMKPNWSQKLLPLIFAIFTIIMTNIGTGARL